MDLTKIINTEKVEIPGTSDTPKVALDRNSGKFSFSGRSLPQNPKEFYNPILNWISAYSKQPQKETHLVFSDFGYLGQRGATPQDSGDRQHRCADTEHSAVGDRTVPYPVVGDRAWRAGERTDHRRDTAGPSDP